MISSNARRQVTNKRLTLDTVATLVRFFCIGLFPFDTVEMHTLTATTCTRQQWLFGHFLTNLSKQALTVEVLIADSAIKRLKHNHSYPHLQENTRQYQPTNDIAIL